MSLWYRTNLMNRFGRVGPEQTSRIKYPPKQIVKKPSKPRSDKYTPPPAPSQYQGQRLQLAVNSPEAIKLISEIYHSYMASHKGGDLGARFGAYLKQFVDFDNPAIYTDSRLQRQHMVFNDTHPVTYSANPRRNEKLETAVDQDDRLKGIINIVLPGGFTKISDLMRFAVTGMDGAKWYEEWKGFLEQHPLSNEAEKNILKHLFGVTGQGTSVDTNYGLVHKTFNRLRSGLWSNQGEIDDLKSRGILPALTTKDVESGNLARATHGVNPITPKILDYLSPFLGLDGAAIDEWMYRLFTGENGAPQTQHEYADIQGRVRGVRDAMNAQGIGGRHDWTTPEIQASMWVGFKRFTADKLDDAIEKITAHIEANPDSKLKDYKVIHALQHESRKARAAGDVRTVLKSYGMLNPDDTVKTMRQFRFNALVKRHVDKLKELSDRGLKHEWVAEMDIDDDGGREIVEALLDNPKNSELAHRITWNRNHTGIIGSKVRIMNLLNQGIITNPQTGEETTYYGYWKMANKAFSKDRLPLINVSKFRDNKDKDHPYLGPTTYYDGPESDQAVTDALEDPDFRNDLLEMQAINNLSSQNTSRGTKQVSNSTATRKLSARKFDHEYAALLSQLVDMQTTVQPTTRDAILQYSHLAPDVETATSKQIDSLNRKLTRCSKTDDAALPAVGIAGQLKAIVKDHEALIEGHKAEHEAEAARDQYEEAMRRLEQNPEDRDAYSAYSAARDQAYDGLGVFSVDSGPILRHLMGRAQEMATKNPQYALDPQRNITLYQEQSNNQLPGDYSYDLNAHVANNPYVDQPPVMQDFAPEPEDEDDELLATAEVAYDRWIKTAHLNRGWRR